MSESKVFIDKKDKAFDMGKAPIINLVNSVLKVMEQIQWHLSTPKDDGGNITIAINLLGIVQNRVKIPDSETQLLGDRDLLRRRLSGGHGCYMNVAMFHDMVNRFNLYLLSDLFAEQHGITFQNQKPKHIGE